MDASPPKMIVKWDCSDRGCPTVYDDHDSFLIQGYEAAGAIDSALVPVGENVVRIPKALIRQLAEAIDL